MDSFFAAAFSTRRETVVLGRKLGEFSLWHSLVLELADSPFVGGEREYTAREFLIAVEICAMVPQPERLEVPRLPRGWRAAVWFAWEMRRWRKRIYPELAKFQAYIREHCAGPRQMDSQGEPLKTPWQLYLAARLLSAGMSEERVWRMSPGRAKWWSAALAEAAGGDVNVISDRDAEVMREGGWEIPEFE